jgi:tRNA A-37 threonylcarbamoyl transferase component Bud32
MVRARKLGVLTAVLYAVDLQEASISMERVDGSTVKALLHNSTLQGAGDSASGVAVHGSVRWVAGGADERACRLATCN